MDKIKAEDFIKATKQMKAETEDETPFLDINPDKTVSVIGDPNQIEVKKTDIYARYRLPKDKFPNKPDGADDYGNCWGVDLAHEEVFIHPRKDAKMQDWIMELYTFMLKIKPDGEDDVEIEDMKEQELLHMFAMAGDRIQTAFYNIVGTYLGIEDELLEYMTVNSVMRVFSILADRHPEMLDQARRFFD